MKKNRLLLLLASFCLILVMAAACAQATPTPAPAPKPSPAPAPAPSPAPAPAPSPAPKPSPSPSPSAAPVIELKYAHHNPPTGTVELEMAQPWIKRVVEATKGKVKITTYPAQALGKMTESFDITAKGIADLAWNVSAVNPGRFTMIESAMLPGIGIPTGRAGSEILWKLYQQYTKEVDAQFPGVKIMYLSVHTPAPVYTAKKQVTKLEDLQGLKLRTLGGPPTTFLKNAGASPVVMGIPDVYMGLQTGVIDGCTIDWVGYGDYKLAEVTKFAAEANFYCSSFYVVMNLDTWNKLPPDVQQGIMSVSGMTGVQNEGDVWDRVAASARKASQDKGVAITTMTKDELAKWFNLGKPIWDDYAKQLNDKGLPGTKLVADTLALVEQYKK